MTVLEGVIATVLLALVAVACLDGSRGAAQLQHRSQARLDALVMGETALEATALEASSVLPTERLRTTVSPYRVRTRDGMAGPGGGNGAIGGDAPTLSRVDVEVRAADGGVVRLSRLVVVPARATGAAP